jgi:Hemolysins and related proteins containing CBS domains
MPEDDPLIWQLLLQVFLIALNAVFACAEIAVISLNENKLEKRATSGDRRAVRLLSLTKQPAKFLATIQVGITLAGFLASAFAADNFSDRLVNWMVARGSTVSPATLNTASVILITVILSYFTLILGELVPKRVAMQNAEKLGLAMSGMVFFISRLFAPLVWLLTSSTNALLRLIGIDPNASGNSITEEEIRLMVDVGTERGAIDADEKYIIQNVFEFDDTTASEIMTHRTDVLLLWLEDTDQAWDKTITESRFSYYPICGESVDDIEGILCTKDYFRLESRDREHVMKQAVRPAQFVPESVRADVLFRNMKNNRNHFAVVLDEHGGVSGVITMNDLLEELVGDLEDDQNAPVEHPLVEQIAENTWKINGAVPLEEVADALDVPLPLDEYDTFTGMVFGQLGVVPEDGETPTLNAFGLQIHVNLIADHRLEEAIVRIEKDGATADDLATEES